MNTICRSRLLCMRDCHAESVTVYIRPKARKKPFMVFKVENNYKKNSPEIGEFFFNSDYRAKPVR